MQNIKNKQNGFSLVELLAVLLVFGTIVLIIGRYSYEIHSKKVNYAQIDFIKSYEMPVIKNIHDSYTTLINNPALNNGGIVAMSYTAGNYGDRFVAQGKQFTSNSSIYSTPCLIIDKNYQKTVANGLKSTDENEALNWLENRLDTLSKLEKLKTPKQCNLA